MHSWILTICLAVAAASSVIPRVRSVEWSQFGGPRRDFTVAGKGVASTWPDSGPKTLWRRSLGEGYSPVAVDRGQLFTMYQRDDQEIVIAMDAATGRTLWEHAYKAPITVNMSRAPGPRATPLVVGDTVFTAGATGKLHCLDRQTGRVIWAHDLFKEFGGHVQDEYYASSPIAYRSTLVVPVGAAGGAVMAFDQRTGAVVWKAHDYKISYASPILIDVDGQTQAVVVMESEVIGLDPANGALLWSHPHRNATRTNVSTPVWGEGNLLFVSSAYDSVGRMLRLSRQGAATTVQELWTSRDLRVHVGNAVRIGGTIYGSSGDFGPTSFAALDVQTGQVRWQQRGFSKVSFLNADGRFIMLTEDGELLLASPTDSGLAVHARVQVLAKTSWTPPSMSGTTLYIRDRVELVALDLKGS
jgi:outer membrane protein assembly factor BamB